jgi:hypothetical protein
MFTDGDVKQVRELGISEEMIAWQMDVFRKGVPFMKLDRAATVGDGIIQPDADEEYRLFDLYETMTNISPLKFIPASGAASRMFKILFEYLEKGMNEPEPESAVREVIEKLDCFAFYSDLKSVLAKEGKQLDDLLQKKDYLSIFSSLLREGGLNYGSLPKGLLKFHSYKDSVRTAFEEHIVEAASYASDGNKASLHFTVSPEHMEAFRNLLKKILSGYEDRFGIRFVVDFSVQKPSTDTMAVDGNNQPFRNHNGSILFRPGGHGALLNNLNELDADLIFIKNIDNVVPEKYLDLTTRFKKILAGKLIEIRDKVYQYLQELERPGVKDKLIKEIYTFIRRELCYEPQFTPDLGERNESVTFLKKILNRPIRICGVVKNLGEPGGGPYWAPNSNGDICLQIIESSQVDFNNGTQKEIFTSATHFNPVDLVCCPKNYKGKKFDLSKFVDPSTCFISKKSKDGKDLKALELPGLWNGAMADWLTLFMEVPVETFNPVKTINDLLREKHQ